MYFNEIYRKHYHELKRFGRQLKLPDVKCEDLTQETFLRFYTELSKNVTFDNPRAWLYRVYLNLFRTNYIREKSFSGTEEVFQKERPDEDLHDEFTKGEKQKIVYRMLEKLEEREKEILLLYNDGLTYAEIAEALEMNQNSVGKTLVRAIGKLRDILKTNYHELFEQN